MGQGRRTNSLMFEKNILNEQFLIIDFVPEILKINYNEIIQQVLLKYYQKERLDDDKVYYGYNYTKYDYHQHIQWIQDYIRDHYKVEHVKTPILIKQGAIIQAHNQSIGNHHHIDEWNYNESPDISALICLEPRDISSEIIFEYEVGRSKKRRWSIPMQKNKIILFSSDITHRLTENKNKDPILNLSFQFQLL